MFSNLLKNFLCIIFFYLNVNLADRKCFEVSISRSVSTKISFRIGKIFKEDPLKATGYVYFRNRTAKKSYLLTPKISYFGRVRDTFLFGQKLCKRKRYDFMYHFLSKELILTSKD